MSRSREFLLGAALAIGLGLPALAAPLSLGRPALPEELAAWDVAVLPDGRGLKPGSGDVETGDAVFGEKCASCHGEFAEGLDSWPVLAGGQGSLRDPRPIKTVGSYWPYLSTVWDYVHRSMPFGSAQTVTPDEAYAITAFLLYSNGLVEDDFALSNENFAEIQMPNQDGFYVDDRPQAEYPLFSKEPCETSCLTEVRITKRASDLNVTPMDPDGAPAGTLPDIRPPTNQAKGEAKDHASAAPAEATGARFAAAEPAPPATDPELVAAGEKIFRKCAACHKIGADAKNGTGPALRSIVGHPAGAAEGFSYSKAMQQAGADGLVWDETNLDAFLTDPKDFVKGTKMTFAGLKKPDERAALIAYLDSMAPK